MSVLLEFDLIFRKLLVMICDKQDQEKNDIFTDLSQVLPSDETGPEYSNQKSPYFSGGRKSGAFKRKRGSARSGGGEKKLTKNGKWLKKGASSGNKSSGTAYKKSSSGRAGTSSSRTSSAGLNLLAPPRARAVKKE